MNKLPYIEDYIELMVDNALTWPPREKLIKLARYDEPIVYSMTEQFTRNLGFTDRQAVLAHKLVCKYKRQWASIGYDITDHETHPRYRLPIRNIDRTRQIDIQDNLIVLKFPYDQAIISELRATVPEMPGRLVWDKDKRYWIAACIEPRLIWAKEFGLKHNFEFSPEFNQAIALMLAQDDYAIRLQRENNKLTITNAADSLIDFIQEHGGFENNNFMRLLDYAGVLDYEVDPGVYDLFDHVPSPEIITMLTQRNINIEYGNAGIDLAPVIEYANLVNRFPIYVYESGSSQLKSQLTKYFSEQDIVFRKTKSGQRETGRVIYFNHWHSADSNIPLLITTHTLMIGSRRQQVLQSSEKVIYFTQNIEHD